MTLTLTIPDAVALRSPVPGCPLLSAAVLDLPDRLRLVTGDGGCLDLAEPPAGLAGVLARCDGQHDLAQLLARVADPDRPAVTALLGELVRAGLLVQGWQVRSTLIRVAVVGSGELAQAVLAGLLTLPSAGITWVNSGGTAQYSPAAGARTLPAVGTAGGARWRQLDHWTALGEDHDLVVVAPSTREPDRGLTRALRSRHLPHLLVRADTWHGVVGPLIDDSEGVCQECLDLALLEHDEAWLGTLARLSNQPASPAPPVLAWAAGQVTAWAHSYCRSGLNALRDRQLELDLSRAVQGLRHWAPRSDCSCRSAAATLAA